MRKTQDAAVPVKAGTVEAGLPESRVPEMELRRPRSNSEGDVLAGPPPVDLNSNPITEETVA